MFCRPIISNILKNENKQDRLIVKHYDESATYSCDLSREAIILVNFSAPLLLRCVTL